MTYQISEIIEAVTVGSLDRDIAMQHKVGAPHGLVQHIIQMTDAQLAEGASMTAANDMQRRCIDCAKIEIAYRAR